MTDIASEEGRPDAGVTVDGEPFNGYIVAIGASAGGLDALERLFDALPVSTEAAFVVIQHLSPDHRSMMDNLLARHTSMPVREATHEMALHANHVYLIPPGMEMTVVKGRLQLAKRPGHGLSLPIDVFFRSMAEYSGPRAVAVVLSGTGSDGARGVLSVNEEGGLVLVQEPRSARFDGMPRSAIATGRADEILAPAELAERMVKHLGNEPPLPARPLKESLAEPHLTGLESVLTALASNSGIDFREYKPATVIRRIERRMQVRHCRTFNDYLACLHDDPGELVTLRRELLIPVTRFFRDTEAFDVVAAEVVDKIVAAHDNNDPIRVWVAACSTGEEAYSIAILFAEASERLRRWAPIKIFATDIEPEYLDFASNGLYPETIEAEVPAHRLERFFTRRGGAYAVRTELRQMMIFARHNLAEDPPFTKMDLVSCRNMLIYLQPRAQDAVMSRLHYALVPGGYMFMGSSESIGRLHDDFVPISTRHKVYRALRRGRALVSASTTSVVRATTRERRAPTGSSHEARLEQAALNVLLRDHAPAALLVGPDRTLIHVFGGARRYLRVPEGAASLDVVNLLPTEIGATISAMIHMAARDDSERRSSDLTVPLSDGTVQRLRLLVRPVTSEDGHEPGLLIVFERLSAGEHLDVPVVPLGDKDLRSHIEMLERELAGSRAHLQTTIEELETANEELQATNEELIASNEELQSTNEELQSVNEELFTVNTEYQEKVDVLNKVNADLENMLRASAIPTLFVDESLRLTRFTPEVASFFKLRASDLGRSIEDFSHSFDYPEFFPDLRRTIADGQVVEREVRARDGSWHLCRMQPYALSNQGPRRAVTTFVDVSRLKDAQRLQAVIDSLPEHVAVLDQRGIITMVNRAWRDFALSNGGRMHHCGPGSDYLSVCNSNGDVDATVARQGLLDVLTGRRDCFSLQYPCHSPDEERWFLMHAAPIASAEKGAIVSHINITEFMKQSGGS